MRPVARGPIPRRNNGYSRVRQVTWLLLALATTPGWVACGGSATPQEAEGPKEALDAYATALSAGRLQEAYAWLSDDAKKNLPFEAFKRMVEENPDEVRALAVSLRRPAGAPLVTATVVAPGGEKLLLVYEDGRWRVDASAIDLYSQATPEAAVTAFIRAFESKRWDVLMRFVPEQRREGLNAAKLQKAWEGEQKEEMERLTQALEAALPTARFEIIGDRATMAYGAGGTVELLLEEGSWRIEEFR